jgi:hypothetical protein
MNVLNGEEILIHWVFKEFTSFDFNKNFNFASF